MEPLREFRAGDTLVTRLDPTCERGRLALQQVELDIDAATAEATAASKKAARAEAEGARLGAAAQSGERVVAAEAERIADLWSTAATGLARAAESYRRAALGAIIAAETDAEAAGVAEMVQLWVRHVELVEHWRGFANQWGELGAELGGDADAGA